jgi:myosin protein heavy chain
MQAQLENQIKDLNLRLVDFETKSYTTPSVPARSRRLESRIEELTSKLTQESREKTEFQRHGRDADKTARELRLELTESERQRLKLQEEIQANDERVAKLRGDIAALVRSSRCWCQQRD